MTTLAVNWAFIAGIGLGAATGGPLLTFAVYWTMERWWTRHVEPVKRADRKALADAYRLVAEAGEPPPADELDNDEDEEVAAERRPLDWEHEATMAGEQHAPAAR